MVAKRNDYANGNQLAGKIGAQLERNKLKTPGIQYRAHVEE